MKSFEKMIDINIELIELKLKHHVSIKIALNSQLNTILQGIKNIDNEEATKMLLKQKKVIDDLIYTRDKEIVQVKDEINNFNRHYKTLKVIEKINENIDRCISSIDKKLVDSKIFDDDSSEIMFIEYTNPVLALYYKKLVYKIRTRIKKREVMILKLLSEMRDDMDRIMSFRIK